MKNRAAMRSLATMSACAALAVAVAVGCTPPRRAKVLEQQPIALGTTAPASPVASAPAPATPPGSSEPRAEGGAVPAPIDLASLTTSGKVSIAADHVVVVHFFATWCGPCKRTLPKLQEMYAGRKAKGLNVIAVSVDDSTNGVGEYARKLGAKFPVGWDVDHQLSQSWKVDQMPATYVIDRSGKVVHTHLGFKEGMLEKVAKEVDGLL